MNVMYALKESGSSKRKRDDDATREEEKIQPIDTEFINKNSLMRLHPHICDKTINEYDDLLLSSEILDIDAIANMNETQLVRALREVPITLSYFTRISLGIYIPLERLLTVWPMFLQNATRITLNRHPDARYIRDCPSLTFLTMHLIDLDGDVVVIPDIETINVDNRHRIPDRSNSRASDRAPLRIVVIRQLHLKSLTRPRVFSHLTTFRYSGVYNMRIDKMIEDIIKAAPSLNRLILSCESYDNVKDSDVMVFGYETLQAKVWSQIENLSVTDYRTNLEYADGKTISPLCIYNSQLGIIRRRCPGLRALHLDLKAVILLGDRSEQPSAFLPKLELFQVDSYRHPNGFQFSSEKIIRCGTYMQPDGQVDANNVRLLARIRAWARVCVLITSNRSNEASEIKTSVFDLIPLIIGYLSFSTKEFQWFTMMDNGDLS